MSKLEQLQVDNAAPQVSFESLPDEGMGLIDPPYPGAYTFQLPGEFDWDNLLANIKDAEGKVVQEKAPRIKTIFDVAHPLTIAAATPENEEYIGKAVNYQISNAEFTYGKDKVYTSEMGWLLKNGLGVTLPDGSGNLAYAQELEKKAGAKFGGDIEWGSYCNPDKPRYILDEATGGTRQDTKTGCGRRYAQEAWKDTGAIPRHPNLPEAQLLQMENSGDQAQITQAIELREKAGKFTVEFRCTCGAMVRCFPRIRRYRGA
jgi:hypothetical protein